MKQVLSKSQSRHLVKLGVPHQFATQLISDKKDLYPNFSVVDLIGLFPHIIRSSAHGKIYLTIETYGDGRWVANYNWYTHRGSSGLVQVSWARPITPYENLIDALYDLLIWCIEHKYLIFS